MSQFNGGMPRWWRRFNKRALLADLVTGRKVINVVTDDEGVRTYFVEVLSTTIPFPEDGEQQPMPSSLALTSDPESDTMLVSTQKSVSEGV